MSRRSNSAGLRPGPVVAILGYHKIGEPSSGGWSTWFYIPEETFRRQLEVIDRSGWHPIDLPTFLRGLEEPASLPPRATLLSFDDAHRSVRDVALPWLRRFGYPAVVFAPTEFVGGESTFDANEPIERLCDWDDLRALERCRVSVQSHGATHRAFSTLDGGAREREVRVSRDALQVGLGKRVEALAFPYGDDGDGGVRALLKRAGYRSAFLYGGGPVVLPTDPYRLSRIAMGRDTDLTEVLR